MRHSATFVVDKISSGGIIYNTQFHTSILVRNIGTHYKHLLSQMVDSKVLIEWTFGYVKPFLSWIMIDASWSGIIQIKNNHFWMNVSFFFGTTRYYLIIWMTWTRFSTPNNPSKSQHLGSFWDIYPSKKGSWSKAHQRNQAIQELKWPDPCDFVKSENPGGTQILSNIAFKFQEQDHRERHIGTLKTSRYVLSIFGLEKS